MAAGAVWVLFGWFVAPGLARTATPAIVMALVLFALPGMIAGWHWMLCGAWNSTGQRRRCRNRRRGFLVRCHHHGGVTLYDFLGLIWVLACVAVSWPWWTLVLGGVLIVGDR